LDPFTPTGYCGEHEKNFGAGDVPFVFDIKANGKWREKKGRDSVSSNTALLPVVSRTLEMSLLEPIKGMFPRMEKMWVDQAHTGKGRTWIKEQMGWEVEIARHAWSGRRWIWAPKDAVINWDEIIPPGFHVLPRRWVVERSFAWMGWYRRMSKDYEYLTISSESMVHLTMIRLMVRRLAGTTETARENAQRRRVA
jgi:transposase